MNRDHASPRRYGHRAAWGPWGRTERPRSSSGESGQAVVEFGFILLCTAMIIFLMFTLFLFAEDIFNETSRVRSETLKRFHDDVQFYEAGGKVYRPQSPITVNVRRLGMIASFIGNPPTYRGTISMTGGTKVPYENVFAKWMQCLIGSAAVTKFTRSNHRINGHGVGGGAAFGMCISSLVQDWFPW